MPSVKVSSRIPDSLVLQIDVVCAYLRIPRSQFIATAIRRYLRVKQDELEIDPKKR